MPAERGLVYSVDKQSETGAVKEQLVASFISADSKGFSLDFIQRIRTSDNIRRNFLSKLTYQKIWLTPSEKPKLHETAIIFDWDDTLLCTSFINPSGVYEPVEISQNVKNHIRVLDGVAAR